MNYAVNVEQNKTDKLIITPRKRNQKFSLLSVTAGLVLIRLGKLEYAIEAGQAWWIPFDCLTSLTYLPETTYSKIDFSVRIPLSLPYQSGEVELTPLVRETITRVSEISRDNPIFDPLTAILKYEAARFRPRLIESRLSKTLSDWQGMTKRDDPLLTNELQLALQIREAHKQEQSGKKEQAVADTLFEGNLGQYRQLKQILLG